MLYSSSFGRHVKSIRTAYKLSLGDFCGILNIKSKGNVYQWERGTGGPLVELLYDLAQLFAVKIDWLLGRSDRPYDNDVMLFIEDLLLKSHIIVNGSPVAVFSPASVPEDYLDAAKRQCLYSLGVRANIVYLMHLELAFMQYAYSHECGPMVVVQSASPVNRLAEYYKVLKDGLVFRRKAEKHEADTQRLLKLLKDPLGSVPIYDLEKIEKAAEA